MFWLGLVHSVKNYSIKKSPSSPSDFVNPLTLTPSWVIVAPVLDVGSPNYGFPLLPSANKKLLTEQFFV